MKQNVHGEIFSADLIGEIVTNDLRFEFNFRRNYLPRLADELSYETYSSFN